LSLIVGVLMAAPFIMYQLWLFIAPGLYANEKKMAIPFVLLSTLASLRRGLQPLHHVPWMMAFFASFNTQDLVFIAEARFGVLAVHEVSDRDGGGVSDADARVFLRRCK